MSRDHDLHTVKLIELFRHIPKITTYQLTLLGNNYMPISCLGVIQCCDDEGFNRKHSFFISQCPTLSIFT